MKTFTLKQAINSGFSKKTIKRMQENGLIRKKEHVLSAKTVRLIAQNKKLENDLAGMRSLS